MSFNLQKSVEDAEQRFKTKGFTLRKENRSDGLTARVWAVMDGSGSAKSLWLGGTMQQAIQLVLPTAILVDDDGQLPVAVFNDGSNFTILDTPMTGKNFEGFVESHIVTSKGRQHVNIFGGTDYSPVLRAIVEKEGLTASAAVPKKGFLGFFGGAKKAVDTSRSQVPVVIEFFTDGACSPGDERVTAQLLETLEKSGARVYVLFIGVGSASFRYIERLADDRGNVGFVNIEDLSSAVSSDTIMEQRLPDELLGWLKKK